MDAISRAQIEKRETRNTYLLMGIMALFFGALITKEVSLPKLILIGGALVGGFVLIFQGVSRPEFITYFLVTYLPFSKMLTGGFGGLAQAFNLTNILLILLVAVWLTGRYSDDEPLWIPSPLNLLVMLFILLGCLAVARGAKHHVDFFATAMVQFKRWITPIVLYFLVLNTVKRKSMIRTIVMIMGITTTIVGLMAIYDYINLGTVTNLERARIGGISGHSNTLAAFFNYYMFLPFGFFLMNMNRLPYWGLLIPFLIQFRGIMVTFSRGGYIAFAFGLLTIIFFRSKVLFALLILGSVLAYFNPELLPGGIRYRMGQTLTGDISYLDGIEDIDGNLEASAQSRIDIWKGAIEMIKEHPIFGVGYGLFQQTIPNYWPGGPIDAHNTYLIIAAEMGIPTLIVFLLIVFVVMFCTWRLYKTTQDRFTKAFALGFLGGLGGLLMSNMFGSRLESQEVAGYFWILCALVMRLRILQKRGDLDEIKDEKAANESSRPSRQGKLDACWFEGKA